MNRYYCALLSSALITLNLSASPITLVEYDFDQGSSEDPLNGQAVTTSQAFEDAGGGTAWVANDRFKADSSHITGSAAEFLGYITLGNYINDHKGNEDGLFELTGTMNVTGVGNVAPIGFSRLAAPPLNVRAFSADAQGWGTVSLSSTGTVISRLANTGTYENFGATSTAPITIGLDFRPSSGYNGTDNFGTIYWRNETGILATATIGSNVAFNSIAISNQIAINESRPQLMSGSFTLTQILSQTDPFGTWAASGTLPGTVTFDGDLNGDGVQDGIAFLLGVANPDDDATGALPTASEDGSGGLVLTFDCLALADRGPAQLRVAHSNSLAGWTATTDVVPDADGTDAGGIVSYVVDTVSADPLHRVTATIDAAAASAGRLFGRLEGAE